MSTSILKKILKYKLTLNFFLFYFIILTANLKAACPSEADSQTVNILTTDSCEVRISNPLSVNIASGGSNVVDSGDGLIYANTGSVIIENDGTLINTNTNPGSVIFNTGGNLTITNNGIMSGGFYGINQDSGAIDAIINTGMISANTLTGIANNGTIGDIDNFGNIIGGYKGITNTGAINNIINYTTGEIYEIDNSTSSAIINSIINEGLITGNVESIKNSQGTISTITNTGQITSLFWHIANDNGTITTLNNRQGAKSGDEILNFLKRLPTNYNIIINSTSDYGKIKFTEPSGTLNFGIYAGSVVAAGTYEDVLMDDLLDANTGVNALDETDIGSLNGTYGAYNWELVFDGDNFDLVFTSSRSPYNSRVTSSNLTTFATHLETMRTNGRKVALTDILDDLTDDQFNTALKKMKGATSNITNNQSLNAQSNFRTAQSIMTSPVATSKVTNLIKTNAGNLTLADLKKNNLYASIQPAKFSSDNNFFNQETNQSSINVLEFFKSNRNTAVIDKDFNEKGFYLKTFGSTSNYAAINNDDNGYNSDTFGLLGGFSNKIDDNLYQGYSLGFSRSKLTLDSDEGNSKTNTIHVSIHRNIDDKEYALGASLGAYISSVDNIRNISETSEVLKSSPTNGGLDLQLEYVKKMNLFGLNFYPSISLTTSYGIIEDYRETGGVGSALHVKSDNVLVIKPEIGFTLENNFVQTEKITQSANFSLFANRQQYLDGYSTTTSLIDENFSNSNTLPKTKNHFLTAGIGYVAKNIDEKSDLNFNFFYTQSTNNALNSSLFSISYNKVF